MPNKTLVIFSLDNALLDASNNIKNPRILLPILLWIEHYEHTAFGLVSQRPVDEARAREAINQLRELGVSIPENLICMGEVVEYQGDIPGNSSQAEKIHMKGLWNNNHNARINMLADAAGIDRENDTVIFLDALSQHINSARECFSRLKPSTRGTGYSIERLKVNCITVKDDKQPLEYLNLLAEKIGLTGLAEFQRQEGLDADVSPALRVGVFLYQMVNDTKALGLMLPHLIDDLSALDPETSQHFFNLLTFEKAGKPLFAGFADPLLDLMIDVLKQNLRANQLETIENDYLTYLDSHKVESEDCVETFRSLLHERVKNTFEDPDEIKYSPDLGDYKDSLYPFFVADNSRFTMNELVKMLADKNAFNMFCEANRDQVSDNLYDTIFNQFLTDFIAQLRHLMHFIGSRPTELKAFIDFYLLQGLSLGEIINERWEVSPTISGHQAGLARERSAQSKKLFPKFDITPIANTSALLAAVPSDIRAKKALLSSLTAKPKTAIHHVVFIHDNSTDALRSVYAEPSEKSLKKYISGVENKSKAAEFSEYEITMREKHKLALLDVHNDALIAGGVPAVFDALVKADINGERILIQSAPSKQMANNLAAAMQLYKHVIESDNLVDNFHIEVLQAFQQQHPDFIEAIGDVWQVLQFTQQLMAAHLRYQRNFAYSAVKEIHFDRSKKLPIEQAAPVLTVINSPQADHEIARRCSVQNGVKPRKWITPEQIKAAELSLQLAFLTRADFTELAVRIYSDKLLNLRQVKPSTNAGIATYSSADQAMQTNIEKRLMLHIQHVADSFSNHFYIAKSFAMRYELCKPHSRDLLEAALFHYEKASKNTLNPEEKSKAREGIMQLSDMLNRASPSDSEEVQRQINLTLENVKDPSALYTWLKQPRPGTMTGFEKPLPHHANALIGSPSTFFDKPAPVDQDKLRNKIFHDEETRGDLAQTTTLMF